MKQRMVSEIDNRKPFYVFFLCGTIRETSPFDKSIRISGHAIMET